MHKRITFSTIIAIVVLSVFSVAADTKAPPTTLPSDASQTDVKTWIDGLRDKTEPEILALLGKEIDRTTWKSGDEGGLKLKFKLGVATIDVLFSGDRVIYATYTISSGD